MTDITPQPEKQIEQVKPQIEAQEASVKVASAKDVAPGTQPAESSNENAKLKIEVAEQGNDNMQGTESKLLQANDAANYADRTFTDKQGRPVTIRTWQSSDSVYARAYDQNVGPPPEGVNIGQAGYANLHLERDPGNGAITKARLQDIEAYPNYRGGGTGAQLLETCEQTARQHGAQEIYGVFEPRGDPDAVRAFYQRRGYSFQPGVMGGEQVYKKLI